ncbi:EAL domain-containing protein [Vibrio cholerae]
MSTITLEDSNLFKKRKKTKPLYYSENIEPFYQPIINNKQKMIGFEALARYREDSHQAYKSVDFKSLSKDEALYVDIIMLKSILLHLPTLAKSQVCILSINLNPVLHCSTYQNLLLIILSQASKLGIVIWLEVLEIAQLNSKDVSIIEKLRNDGARIACDDFGSHKCNFQRIIMLPYDIIKLDRSLLLQAAKNAHALRMLKGMVKCLQQNNIKIVCEGVENQKHIEIVNSLGCEYQQGYAYAIPSQLSNWL